MQCMEVLVSERVAVTAFSLIVTFVLCAVECSGNFLFTKTKADVKSCEGPGCRETCEMRKAQ